MGHVKTHLKRGKETTQKRADFTDHGKPTRASSHLINPEVAYL